MFFSVFRKIGSLPKMKAFTVEKALTPTSAGGSVGRLGSLQLTVTGKSGEVEGKNNALEDKRTYQSPMYLIHTQTGSIPHITPEVFKMIYPTSFSTSSCTSPPLQISVDGTFRFAESLEKFNEGIGKFVGFPDYPTFLTVHDPLQALRAGHNDKFGIALWSRHGRVGLTPERFSDMLSTSYKSELSQIISDYDVKPEKDGMKRLKKSLSRAEEYTSMALTKQCQKRTGLFVTIESKWFSMDEELSKKTVQSLLESQQEIEGVVIAGIYERYGKIGIENAQPTKNKASVHLKDSEKLPICEKVDLDVVEKIGRLLPSNLPRYTPGPFTLEQIVTLVERGVDLFDSSMASRMADYGKAFLLDEVEHSLHLLSSSLPALQTSLNESLPDRQDSSLERGTTNGVSIPESPVISLRYKRYFDDFGPLSKTCTCYTCRKHTRSYIHHLYATDELLGPVLIQIHNLTSLDRFFDVVRGIIADCDNSEELHKRLELLKKCVTVESNSTDSETSIEECEDETKESHIGMQTFTNVI